MKYKSYQFVVFEIANKGTFSFKENEIMYGESQELKINNEIFIIQPIITIEQEEEEEEEVSVPTQSENVVNVEKEYMKTVMGDNKIVSQIQNTLNRLCRGIPKNFYPYGSLIIEQEVRNQKVENTRGDGERTVMKDVTFTTFTQMYRNFPDEKLLKFLLFQTEVSMIPGFGAAYLRAEEIWNAKYQPKTPSRKRKTPHGGYRKKRNKSKTHKK
jgi:hypothetical protein